MIKPRQKERIKAGRAARLKAEIASTNSGQPLSAIPLFSHDATIQSFFERGWHSVSPVDIRLALERQLNKDYSNTKDLSAISRTNIQQRLGRTGAQHGLV